MNERSQQSCHKKAALNKTYIKECRAKFTEEKKAALKENDRKRKQMHQSQECNNNMDDENPQRDRVFLANRKKHFEDELKHYNILDGKGLFGCKINELKWKLCILCKSKSFSPNFNCYCYRNKQFMSSPLTQIGDIPPELSILTVVEKLLIAQVHPVVQVR